MQDNVFQRGGLKDGLIQRLEINRTSELLWAPLLSRFWASVQVLQTNIIPKTADNIEAQCLGPGNEGLLGKESISNEAVRQLKMVILERVYGSQINANDGVMIIHVLEIVGNSTLYFVS